MKNLIWNLKKAFAVAMFMIAATVGLETAIVVANPAFAGTTVATVECGEDSSDACETQSDAASYTEFNGIWNRIAAWTSGSLGRVIAGAFVLVGIISGVARQSIMAFAIGISAGLGLVYAPSIIKSLFDGTESAVYSSGTMTVDVLMQL